MKFYTFLVSNTRKVYQYLKCQEVYQYKNVPEVYQSSIFVLSYKSISIFFKEVS